MKVNVEIDCTPLEARQFFGLPDVQPMQTAVMDKLQQQMMANIEKVSPESLMQSWFTFDPKIAERFQDMFVDHGRPRRHRPRRTRNRWRSWTASAAATERRLRPPSLFLMLAEARGLFELNSSLLLAPLLMRAPKGDGHPVLALPGFLASDLSMAPMRRYLKELGYDTHAWNMGRNLGGVAAKRAALRDLAAADSRNDRPQGQPGRLEPRRHLCARSGAADAGDGALRDHARQPVHQRHPGDQRDAAVRSAVGRGGRRHPGDPAGDRRRPAGAGDLDLFPHRRHRELAHQPVAARRQPPKTSRCISPAISASASTPQPYGPWPTAWRRPRANSSILTGRDLLPLPMAPRKMHNPDQRPELRA